MMKKRKIEATEVYKLLNRSKGYSVRKKCGTLNAIIITELAKNAEHGG